MDLGGDWRWQRVTAGSRHQPLASPAIAPVEPHIKIDRSTVRMECYVRNMLFSPGYLLVPSPSWPLKRMAGSNSLVTPSSSIVRALLVV